MLQSSHRNLTPKFLRPVMAKVRSLSPKARSQLEPPFPQSAPNHNPHTVKRRSLYEGSLTCTNKSLTEQLREINQDIKNQCFHKISNENSDQPLLFRKHKVISKGCRSNRSPLHGKLESPGMSAGEIKLIPISYNSPFSVLAQSPNDSQATKAAPINLQDDKSLTKEQQQPESRSQSRCRTRLSVSYSRKHTQSVDFDNESLRKKNNYSVITDDETKDRELAYLNDLCQQLLNEQTNLKARLRNQEDIINKLSVKNATQPIKPSFTANFPNPTPPAVPKSRKSSGRKLPTLALNLERVQDEESSNLDKHANSEFLSPFSADKKEEPQFTFRPGEQKWADCDMSPSSEVKSRSFKFPREIFSTKTRRKRML
jgi:hypothetical protein